MPATMAGLAARSHAVHFYSDDAVLVDIVARVVGTALVVGDPAVVIATESHDAAVRRRLRQRGLDVQVAVDQGRYLAIDAAALAGQFVSGGTLEAPAFRAALDDVVARARAACESAPDRIVIFGELVDLLVRRGALEAALQVERVGNELIASNRVSICCGYGMQSFRGEHGTAPFLHVCGLHSQVFPAERRSSARLMRASEADRR